MPPSGFWDFEFGDDLHWSDARAVDGTTSVVQPLIQPLYGAKSRVELLGLLEDELELPVAAAMWPVMQNDTLQAVVDRRRA